jgi:four helix bundle protein
MKNGQQEDLKYRTRRFALAVIRLYTSLPRSTVSHVLGRQLLRSGTSVGAHYRESQRAKSNPDFISKIEGALQELEETGYWLELLRDSGFSNPERIEPLSAEANELTAIFVSVARTVKSRS